MAFYLILDYLLYCVPNVTVQTVDFEAFVETSYSYDFNFPAVDSWNLFFVNTVTV